MTPHGRLLLSPRDRASFRKAEERGRALAISDNVHLGLFCCGLMNKEQYAVQFHISVSPDTKINNLNTTF